MRIESGDARLRPTLAAKTLGLPPAIAVPVAAAAGAAIAVPVAVAAAAAAVRFASLRSVARSVECR